MKSDCSSYVQIMIQKMTFTPYSDKSYLVQTETYVKAAFSQFTTIFDISMRPVRIDQIHRQRFTVKDGRNFCNDNYSFEFCPLHAAHAWKSLGEK